MYNYTLAPPFWVVWPYLKFPTCISSLKAPHKSDTKTTVSNLQSSPYPKALNGSVARQGKLSLISSHHYQNDCYYVLCPYLSIYLSIYLSTFLALLYSVSANINGYFYNLPGSAGTIAGDYSLNPVYAVDTTLQHFGTAHGNTCRSPTAKMGPPEGGCADLSVVYTTQFRVIFRTESKTNQIHEDRKIYTWIVLTDFQPVQFFQADFANECCYDLFTNFDGFSGSGGVGLVRTWFAILYLRIGSQGFGSAPITLTSCSRERVLPTPAV